MLRKNLAVGVAADQLQQAVPRQTFPPQMSGSSGRLRLRQIPTTRVATLHIALSVVSQSTFFDFKHVQSSPVSSPCTGFHVFYHLCPHKKALPPLEERMVRAKTVTVRSRSPHTAHETRSVLNVVPQVYIGSEPGLIQPTASAVRKVSRYPAHMW